MSSKIYNEIVGHGFRSFLDRFGSTRKWFADELAANRLFHAGEFGASREMAVRELISRFIGVRFDAGHGFIINAHDAHSSQCDVIIYDSSNTPLRDEESGFRFYLAESVTGIGEIKSVLDRSTLKKALVKMAKSKSVCMRAPLSFLICERIDGFDSKIGEFIDKSYREAGVANRHRHTFILSIEDGVCAYEFNHTSTPLVFAHSNSVDWFHDRLDHYEGANFAPLVFASGKTIENVSKFTHLLFEAISMTPNLRIDLKPYLGEG